MFGNPHRQMGTVEDSNEITAKEVLGLLERSKHLALEDKKKRQKKKNQKIQQKVDAFDVKQFWRDKVDPHLLEQVASKHVLDLDEISYTQYIRYGEFGGSEIGFNICKKILKYGQSLGYSVTDTYRTDHRHMGAYLVITAKPNKQIVKPDSNLLSKIRSSYELDGTIAIVASAIVVSAIVTALLPLFLK